MSNSAYELKQWLVIFTSGENVQESYKNLQKGLNTYIVECATFFVLWSILSSFMFSSLLSLFLTENVSVFTWDWTKGGACENSTLKTINYSGLNVVWHPWQATTNTFVHDLVGF